MQDVRDVFTIRVKTGSRDSRHSFTRILGNRSRLQLLELPARIIFDSSDSETGSKLHNYVMSVRIDVWLDDVFCENVLEIFLIISEKYQQNHLPALQYLPSVAR